MNIRKKNKIKASETSDFNRCDEYDVVSTRDLILMSNENIEADFHQNDNSDNLPYANNFSSLQLYIEEWNELYKKELDLEILRSKSIAGQLKNSHFRSIYWRTLLGVLHKQPTQWHCQLQTYRNHYNEVSAEVNHNPWSINGDISFDNPLSQEAESVWQKYFCDEELKGIIYQDVKRTFPDINYFRNEEIQNIMVKILFCYARLNPTLCYRQGMHEILAPLILVLYCDHQAYLKAAQLNPELDKNICEIMNPNFLEQDAYSLFKNIMNQLQYSYRINSKKEQKTDQNEIVSRLEYIKRSIFQQKDPELCAHLEKLDIPMHLFGIRWLRLLFGSEFPLRELLFLWDFLFANNFETINHMVVAMLIAIRHILLEGDYHTCLSTLMKYPSKVSVNYIINYALHLKDPVKYSIPEGSSLINITEYNEKSQNHHHVNKGSKHNSTKPPLWISAKSHFLKLGQSGNGDGLIAQGYAINDSSLISYELEQTKMVLGIVHHKLLQFHAILKQNFRSNVNANIDIVVDGLYELSCLLNNYKCYEIETACEAGENKAQEVTASNTKLMVQTPMDSENRTLSNIKKGLRSGELKVFKQQSGGSMSGGPMTDPLHLIKGTDF